MLNTLAILLVVGSIAIWLFVLSRLMSGRPLLETEPRRPVPWQAIDLLVVLLIYLFTQVTCLQLAARWMQASDVPVTAVSPQNLAASLLANTVANLLVMLLSITYLRLRCGPTVGDLAFLPWRPGTDLPLGLLAFVAAFAPVFAIQALATQLIPYEHPIQDLLTRIASPRMLLLCVVSAVFAAPLAEEFLFRVLLQGWMESIVLRGRGEPEPAVPSPPAATVVDAVTAASIASSNPYQSPAPASHPIEPIRTGVHPRLMVAPIVFSSLAFALVHFSNGPAPIPLFVLALVLGYLYQKTHRIWPSVVVHACLNAWSIAALWTRQN